MPINSHPNPWHTMDKISGGKAYTCMRMSTQHTRGATGCMHGAHGAPGHATRQAAASCQLLGNNAVASQLAAATVSTGPVLCQQQWDWRWGPAAGCEAPTQLTPTACAATNLLAVRPTWSSQTVHQLMTKATPAAAHQPAMTLRGKPAATSILPHTHSTHVCAPATHKKTTCMPPHCAGRGAPMTRHKTPQLADTAKAAAGLRCCVSHPAQGSSATGAPLLQCIQGSPSRTQSGRRSHIVCCGTP